MSVVDVVVWVVYDAEEQFKLVWVDHVQEVKGKVGRRPDSGRGFKNGSEVDRLMFKEIFMDAESYGLGKNIKVSSGEVVLGVVSNWLERESRRVSS